MWRSLVAHPLWERRVAGSNPVIPTGRGWTCGFSPFSGRLITTPPQGSDGFSPGVPHCNPGPQPLTTAITVPDLPIGGIAVYGRTAGPIFHDGPGFTNANRAEPLATAEASGFCQDLALANSDYSFLPPDINSVFNWGPDARAHGGSVGLTPVVGSVVVFNPGNHFWSSTHYWNHGTWHVAAAPTPAPAQWPNSTSTSAAVANALA